MKTWTTHSGMKIIRVLAGRSNVFLLTNGEYHILVDTSIRMLRNLLAKRLKRLIPDRLDLLILTHAHFDHAGNARWIRETYHTTAIIHREEIMNLENGYSDVPSGTLPITRLLIRSIPKSFLLYSTFEPCPHDRPAGDRFDLKEYGFNGYLLHTPGHTPGSVSIILDDEIALVGDTMFGIFPRSAFPPFAMDVPAMLQSWDKLLKTGCTWFLPSHGNPRSRALLEKEYAKRIKNGQ